MKILVGVDGSPQSLAALDSFTKHLRWFRDSVQLTLLYSHPPLPYQRAVSWAGHDAVHAYYDEESEQALSGARALLGKLQIAHDVEKRVGDPAEEIVRCADDG